MNNGDGDGIILAQYGEQYLTLLRCVSMMRYKSRIFATAGFVSALAAAGFVMAPQSPVQASSLTPPTIKGLIQSNERSAAPVTDIRAVHPDRFTTDSCEKATWPYIPEDCLTRGEPAARILK